MQPSGEAGEGAAGPLASTDQGAHWALLSQPQRQPRAPAQPGCSTEPHPLPGSSSGALLLPCWSRIWTLHPNSPRHPAVPSLGHQSAHPLHKCHMLTAWTVTTPATEPLSWPAGCPSRTRGGGERGREPGSWWERLPQRRDSKNFDMTSTERWAKLPRVCAHLHVCACVYVCPCTPSNKSVLLGEACFPPSSLSSSAY